jgi:phage terminase small subunit
VDQGTPQKLKKKKTQTLKLIEEKVGKSLEDMGAGEIFLNRIAMACAVRSRINKWDLIKLQIFCKTYDTVRQKTLSIRVKGHQPTDWERISINPKSDRGPISNIYKELRSWTPQNQITPFKMEYKTKQRILN